MQLLERIRRRVEVSSREMEIDRRVRQIGVSQQELNRPQVGAGFQQMRRAIPALRVARRTASQITFDVMGASARQPWCVPGKR